MCFSFDETQVPEHFFSKLLPVAKLCQCLFYKRAMRRRGMGGKPMEYTVVFGVPVGHELCSKSHEWSQRPTPATCSTYEMPQEPTTELAPETRKTFTRLTQGGGGTYQF